MGEMAGYYSGNHMPQSQEPKMSHTEIMLDSYANSSLYWLTRSKEKILVQEMSSEHIDRCIRHLANRQVKTQIGMTWIYILSYEQLKRTKQVKDIV